MLERKLFQEQIGPSIEFILMGPALSLSTSMRVTLPTLMLQLEAASKHTNGRCCLTHLTGQIVSI